MTADNGFIRGHDAGWNLVRRDLASALTRLAAKKTDHMGDYGRGYQAALDDVASELHLKTRKEFTE